MTKDYAQNILSALNNIAYSSIDIRDLNDFIASESSRIVNSYSDFINSEYEGKMDKEIYQAAMKIIKQSQSVEFERAILRNLIQSLIDLIGKSDQKDEQ